MHLGTCAICGKKGMLEDHHVFSGPFRPKSERFGLKVGLCGDSCHRNGPKAAHRCRATADSLKQHWQIKFMQEHQCSVHDFIREFGRNYLDLDQYTDERSIQMNVTALSGRLTRDPEFRRLQDGTPVCNFSIAVDRPNEKDKVDFIDCVAWRQKAEFVSNYFHKGSRIEVSGPITTRTWQKNDGSKQKAVEIRADNVFFGESKKAANGGGEQDYQSAASAPEASGSSPAYGATDFAALEEDDSELPF